jgi:hypothetical protein
LHTFTPVSVSYHYRLTTVQTPITVWLTHCGLLPKAELDHHIPEALHRFELYFKLAVIFAAPLSKRLGAVGMRVVTRVMGMALSAIAMGMLAEGLKGLLPGLAS